MSINEDLSRGQKGEKIAEKYLKEKHKAQFVFTIPGYFPAYDQIAVFKNGKIRTIEVKTDYLEKKTGNIAIEFRYKNKFSGILATQADWYIIILSTRLFCMKKRDLFNFLRENEFKEIDGGDSNMSSFILVPSWELANQKWVDIYDLKKKETKVYNPSTKLHEINGIM